MATLAVALPCDLLVVATVRPAKPSRAARSSSRASRVLERIPFFNVRRPPDSRVVECRLVCPENSARSAELPQHVDRRWRRRSWHVGTAEEHVVLIAFPPEPAPIFDAWLLLGLGSICRIGVRVATCLFAMGASLRWEQAFRMTSHARTPYGF